MIKIHLSRILGDKRWSQAKLAKATGIRPSTISEIYNEFTERINLEHLDKICEALDCDITDVLEYIPNQTQITGENLIQEEHGNRNRKSKV